MRWPPVSLCVVLGVGIAGVEVLAATSPSRVEEVRFPSPALGRESPALVYLPAGYDEAEASRPVLYLLHGRGDDLRAWLEVRDILDGMIAAGRIPPVIAVLPDAPSSRRAGFYLDSQFSGAGDLPAGERIETALARDLPAFMDRNYRTLVGREGRIVGGYSMGGFGAVRFVFAHADRFAAAIVLSPALYLDLPAEDSSMRSFGAFGRGLERFDVAAYRDLSRPWRHRTADSPPVRIFLAVGDDEPVRDEQGHSLTSDTADLHRHLRGVPGVASELRILDGGHDWKVWREAFSAGLLWLLRPSTEIAAGRTSALAGPRGPAELGPSGARPSEGPDRSLRPAR